MVGAGLQKVCSATNLGRGGAGIPEQLIFHFGGPKKHQFMNFSHDLELGTLVESSFFGA
jgi:hypothetical protein